MEEGEEGIRGRVGTGTMTMTGTGTTGTSVTGTETETDETYLTITEETTRHRIDMIMTDGMTMEGIDMTIMDGEGEGIGEKDPLLIEGEEEECPIMNDTHTQEVCARVYTQRRAQRTEENLPSKDEWRLRTLAEAMRELHDERDT